MALTSRKNNQSGDLWTEVNAPGPSTAEGQAEISEARPENREIGTGRVRVTRQARVERVSVYPWEGQNGKPCFRLALELDPNLDPSNRFRRTETVMGLELEIEEKELTGFARLSGRELDIHYLLRAQDVQSDALRTEILRLQDENQRLRARLSSVEEQLQFAIDSQRTQL